MFFLGNNWSFFSIEWYVTIGVGATHPFKRSRKTIKLNTSVPLIHIKQLAQAETQCNELTKFSL